MHVLKCLLIIRIYIYGKLEKHQNLHYTDGSYLNNKVYKYTFGVPFKEFTKQGYFHSTFYK